MLLFLAATARAFTLSAEAPIALPDLPVAIAVARRPEGDRLVVSSAAATDVVGLDGTSLGSFAPTTGALPYDLDGDGFDDLVTCGDAGLDLLVWSAAMPGAPSNLDPASCAALVTEAVAGADGIGVAGDEGVTLWAWNGTGSFVGPTATDLPGGGTVRLAARDANLAAAGVGDTTLAELGSRGVSNLALGGTLADVLDTPGSWLVALSDLRVLRDLEGADTARGAEPVRLLRADLAVDGLDELVILETSQVEVVAGDGSGMVQAALPTPGDALVAVDVNGDGCPDLVVADAISAQLDVLRTGHCPVAPDGDGDGVSVGDGDCDDTNAAVDPGATDRCNGIDDDCDGVVDEPGAPLLTALDEVPEGDAFLAWAATDGCDPGLTWTWTDPTGALATCTVTGAEVDCRALDDGELPLHADATDTEGTLVYSIDGAITIRNVDPSMILPGFLADGELVMDVGEEYDGAFTGTDPGTDTLTFSATGGPDFFQVSPSGNVVINALSPGSWDIRIAVSDEDGGETATTVLYEVDGRGYDTTDTGSGDTSPYDGHVGYSGCANDPGPTDYGCSSPSYDCGGGCCGGGSMAWVLLGGWSLRRRKPRSA